MPESDILLSIDGDTTPLKTALKNTLKWADKEAATFMKFAQFKGIEVTRGMKLPKMPPVTDPFAHYRKTRGRMRGMDIERFPLGEAPIPKIFPEFERISGVMEKIRGRGIVSDPFEYLKKEKTHTGKIIVDEGKRSNVWFRKTMKLFKIDLFWRWIKGAWNKLTQLVPLVRGLANIFSTAIGLILTGLLLPFLPAILDVLKFILDFAVGIFNWTQKNSDFVKTLGDIIKKAFALSISIEGLGKFLAPFKDELLKLIPQPIKTAFALLWKVVEKVAEVFGTLFKPIIDKVIGWLGEKGLTGVLSKVVGAFLGFIARVINPLLWVSLIADILSAIFSLLGMEKMAEFFKVIADVTDVLGWLWVAIKDVVALFGIGTGGNILEKTSGLWEKAKGLVGLQHGDIVTSPTMAMIGEAGPEAVIPLDQMRGGTTINVQGIIDERKFKEIIRSVVTQEMGRTYAVRGGVY